METFDSLDISAAAVLGVFLILVGIGAHRLRLWRSSPGLPYPPGPSPRFLFKNLFDLPKERRYVEYTRWSQRYKSDIVSFHVPGFHTIIINSSKVAKDLFEKRSAIYSDRPTMDMINLAGFEFATGMTPYSDVWRTHRRMVHEMFRPDALPAYEPLQKDMIKQLLQRILEDPNNVVNEVKRHGGSFSTKLAYGRDGNDPMWERYIRVAEEAMEIFSDILFSGAMLLNGFPILKHLLRWLPGIRGVKKLAKKCHLLTDELRNSLFDCVKQDMTNGTASWSLTADYLRKLELEGEKAKFDEDTLKDILASIHIGAADTSIAAMHGVLLELVLHPDIQTLAQTQIDQVVGRDRLPNFSDRPRLPFVDAICREVLRLNPVLPLALTHASLQDDVYDGYFIPKGALVIGNSWAILHDPKVYSEPEKFQPERFITPEGNLSSDDIASAFGFGRRICAGRHFASDALWLVVASLLSTFDLVRAKDAEGNDIELKGDYVDSAISHPTPFVCVAHTRDDKAKILVNSLGD